MIKALAVVLLAPLFVFAQDNATSAAAPTATGSVVPTTISPACASYLSSLNTDSSLAACTQPLLSAASAFSPSSTSSNSAGSLSSTLTTLCDASGCPDTTIRANLANFYAACSAELTSSDTSNTDYAQVRQFYDVLYVVNPLRAAVCSVDNSTGAWCVQEIAHDDKVAAGTNTTSSGIAAVAAVAELSDPRDANIALAQEYLYVDAPSPTVYRRASAPLATPAPLTNDTNILPNSTTYTTTNLAYLFLLPSLPASLLCTPCTRTILTSYIKWESAVPYALGLANSPILGGQAALWQGVGQKCGADFISGVEQGAGAVIGGSLSGAMPKLGDVAGWMGGWAVSLGAAALAAVVAF